MYRTDSRALKTQMPAGIYREIFGLKRTIPTAAYDLYFGNQNTYSWRTSPNSSAEFEYENLSTTALRGQVAHEYRTRFDSGHEFWTERTEYDFGPKLIRITSSNGALEYTGAMALNISGVPVMPSLSLPSTSSKTQDGAKAINMTLPTQAEASLAQFLGELREGLPRVTGLAVFRDGLNTKSLGHEYLNEQFGIVPFMNDIMKAAKAVKKSSQILSQFARDGQRDLIVRRRATIRDETTTSIVPDVSMGLIIPNYAGSSPISSFFSSTSALCAGTEQQRSRAWFSGAYSYHLQEAINFADQAELWGRKADKLLGISLTPDLVWELTPWSWLLDWKLHIGRFLQNVQLLNQDNMVIRYGYIMHRTSSERRYVSKTNKLTSKGENAGRPFLVVTRERKERMRASPYGFGLSPSSFSARQWAILSALGMTRSPQSLNIDG